MGREGAWRGLFPGELCSGQFLWSRCGRQVEWFPVEVSFELTLMEDNVRLNLLLERACRGCLCSGTWSIHGVRELHPDCCLGYHLHVELLKKVKAHSRTSLWRFLGSLDHPVQHSSGLHRKLRYLLTSSQNSDYQT